jgi:hypothetical protein
MALALLPAVWQAVVAVAVGVPLLIFAFAVKQILLFPTHHAVALAIGYRLWISCRPRNKYPAGKKQNFLPMR